jgi:hypothetical protein
MTDISGRYDFRRSDDPNARVMQILQIPGPAFEGQIDQSPINIDYAEASNVITLNDARRPGEIFYVTYYTGSVMCDADGGVLGMGGEFRELELSGGIQLRGAEVATRESGVAGGTATALRTPEIVVTKTLQGSWYAIWFGT